MGLHWFCSLIQRGIQEHFQGWIRLGRLMTGNGLCIMCTQIFGSGLTELKFSDFQIASPLHLCLLVKLLYNVIEVEGWGRCLT